MVFTDSDELWNNDEHDVDRAAVYLEGTGVTWRDLLPEVRQAPEAYWPKVVALAERLLQRQRLTGEETTAVIDTNA